MDNQRNMDEPYKIIDRYVPRRNNFAQEVGVDGGLIGSIIHNFFSMVELRRKIYEDSFDPSQYDDPRNLVLPLETKDEVKDLELIRVLNLIVKNKGNTHAIWKKYDDYTKALEKVVLPCGVVAIKILNRFFDAQIDPEKYPTLTGLRNRIQGSLNPFVPQHLQDDNNEIMDAAAKADTEFRKLSQQEGSLFLPFRSFIKLWQ
jgi:hypothetical protein